MSAPGRSRAAALTLLAGVVALAAAAVIVPITTLWTQQGAELREERRKVLRAEERRRSRETLAQTADAWDGFVRDPGSGLLVSPTDDLAIAATRKRVENAFGSIGGETRHFAAEALPAGRNGVRKIAFELRGTIPRKGLASLLASLESKPPYVIVERFDAKAESGDRLALSIGAGVYRLEGTRP